jgi:MFS-type transporter involved in bile tolerance (Atg22 family)
MPLPPQTPVVAPGDGVAAALGPALFALITTLRSEQAALMVTLCLLLAGAVRPKS